MSLEIAGRALGCVVLACLFSGKALASGEALFKTKTRVMPSAKRRCIARWRKACTPSPGRW
jgi:hypothetical protein